MKLLPPGLLSTHAKRLTDAIEAKLRATPYVFIGEREHDTILVDGSINLREILEAVVKEIYMTEWENS